jgi:PPK2 family polyphosphate:nucleotide phosphotransferase
MYAERKHSLLIVFQAIDAGGKDGAIRRVITGMNPSGVRVVAFKQPTSVELSHDFLWRVHPHAPAKGEVVVFNRSHYEDVLVVRVHNLAPKEVWSERFGMINDFERLLAEQNDTTILKFFLYISKEEQLERFKKRLDDPTKQWKISESDYSERTHWDKYIAAFEDVLEKTSKPHAPWYVIPANRKWFRDVAIARIIAETLEGLDMKMPAPTVDLEAIREQYHAAFDEMRSRK